MKSCSDLGNRNTKLFGAVIASPTGGRVLPTNRAHLLIAARMVDAADRRATSRAPRLDHRRDRRYSMPARPLLRDFDAIERRLVAIANSAERPTVPLDRVVDAALALIDRFGDLITTATPREVPPVRGALGPAAGARLTAARQVRDDRVQSELLGSERAEDGVHFIGTLGPEEGKDPTLRGWLMLACAVGEDDAPA